MLKKTLIVAALAALPFLAGCDSDADVASKNISRAADNFEINRRIVFFNGITDTYVLVVEGRCSVGNDDKPGRLSVTCKSSPNAFKKHYLGLSDNMSFFAEQLENVDAGTHHYRVVFKPQTIIPDIDLRVDTQELAE